MKTNYILALLAIVGGLFAAFTDHSDRNGLYPSWKYEKDRLDGKKIHYISATHLAELLYTKEEGIEILDVRDEDKFEAYHLPLARSVAEAETAFDRDGKGPVIIYGSAADRQPEEMAASLKGEVYVLKGGIEEWYSLVLFPDFTEYRVRNSEKLEQVLQRSRYFGGSPRNTQLLNITVRETRYREGC